MDEPDDPDVTFVVAVRKGVMRLTGPTGGTLTVGARAATNLMAFLLADQDARDALVAESPRFHAAIEEHILVPSRRGGETPWRLRVGDVASTYHDLAESVSFSMEPAEHLKVEESSVRSVPRARPVARENGEQQDHVIRPAGPRLDGTRRGDFDEVLSRRRSHRVFSRRPVELDALEYLLDMCFGIVGTVDPGLGNDVPFKRTVAAGSRNEQWPVVIAYDVAGLPTGSYAFIDSESCLRRLGDAPSRDALDEMVYQQGFAKTCAFAVLLVSDMDELTWKYRTPSAYRLAWADAGALLQSMSLVATNRDLSVVPTGALRHEDVRRAFDLLPAEFATFMLFGGHPLGPSTIERLQAGERP